MSDAAIPPADSTPHTTTTDLADALGLNRRTVSKLRERFPDEAPTANDVAAWRIFCKRRGVRTRPATGDAVTDLMGDPGDGAADFAGGDACGAQGAAPATIDTIPEGFSPTQEVARQTARLRREQADKAQLDRELLERRIIPRDLVAKAIGALAVLVVAELSDLPTAVARTLTDLPRDERARIRREITNAITAARQRIADEARHQLALALSRPPTT